MKEFLFDLLTNSDGRASTTGFIQFISWLVLTGILIHAYWVDKAVISDWGVPATKGVVSAIKRREENDYERS